MTIVREHTRRSKKGRVSDVKSHTRKTARYGIPITSKKAEIRRSRWTRILKVVQNNPGANLAFLNAAFMDDVGKDVYELIMKGHLIMYPSGELDAVDYPRKTSR